MNNSLKINKKIILVTGAAGFIGLHLSLKLLQRGDEVIGIDNINDYYDITLKYARLHELGIIEEDITYNKPLRSSKFKGFTFIRIDIADRIAMNLLFNNNSIELVVNLAAQAGVRHSLENPYVYVDSNVNGFINILEGSRQFGVKHLVYASSSSVYGLNEKFPLSTKDNVDHPVSLYAATKKANELMAHSYSHLYQLPTTGLRFFSIYGPFGRPDMAYFLFTKAILEGQPIKIYNNGDMFRDFTFISDIVEGVIKVIDNIPKGDVSWNGTKPDPSSSSAPFKIYNIGNSCPVNLMDLIKMLEKFLNCKALKVFMPLQSGDVIKTYADSTSMLQDFGYKPTTSIETGIEKFVKWYLRFYEYDS